MSCSKNFEFLRPCCPQLVVLGNAAERQYSLNEPVGCLVLLRAYVELVVDILSVKLHLYRISEYPLREKIDKIEVRCRVQKKYLELDALFTALHKIRLATDQAVYYHEGSLNKAVRCLRIAWRIGLWYYRTFKDSNFPQPGFIEPELFVEFDPIEVQAARQELQEYGSKIKLKQVEIDELHNEVRMSQSLLSEEITSDLNNVAWEEVIEAIRHGEGIWQLPAVIDFGRVVPDRNERREIHVTVAEDCTISSSLVGLAFAPKTLSPGSHTLHLDLSTGGMLPGNRLHGLLQLNAQKHTQSITITGEVAYSTAILESASPIIALTPAESQVASWYYTLTHRAAESLINQLKELHNEDPGKLTSHKKRDLASTLLFQLVGHQPYRWYVRRVQLSNQNIEEEIWDLRNCL